MRPNLLECGGLFTLSFEGPPLLSLNQLRKTVFPTRTQPPGLQAGSWVSCCCRARPSEAGRSWVYFYLCGGRFFCREPLYFRNLAIKIAPAKNNAAENENAAFSETCDHNSPTRMLERKSPTAFTAASVPNAIPCCFFGKSSAASERERKCSMHMLVRIARGKRPRGLFHQHNLFQVPHV